MKQKIISATIKARAELNELFSLQDGQTISIGRSESCDICFRGYEGVSREHAIISIASGRILLKSIGKNGCFVNGDIIQNNRMYPLSETDVIVFGPEGPDVQIMYVKNEVVSSPSMYKQSGISRQLIAISATVFVVVMGVILYNQIEIIQSTISTQNRDIARIDELTQKSSDQLEQRISQLEVLSRKNQEALNKQIDKLIDSRGYSDSGEAEVKGLPIDLESSIFLVANVDRKNNITKIGTAFPVVTDGLLCTNTHVIDGAASILIKYRNQYYRTEVLYSNIENDIALLGSSLNVDPLRHRVVRASDVGKSMFAIGFPWARMTGDYPTVTKGILSGITVDRKHLITDAPINKGNSGGPLIDAHGYVVGINSFIIRGQDIEAGGFAIHIQLLLDITERLGYGT